MATHLTAQSNYVERNSNSIRREEEKWKEKDNRWIILLGMLYIMDKEWCNEATKMINLWSFNFEN